MENVDLKARPPTFEYRAAELESVSRLPAEASVTADLLLTATCPRCGRRSNAVLPTAPFGLLVSLARLVIAVGAAISLMAIVVSVFRWGLYRFVAGELWTLFATFVISVGVLLLYEIRDLLRLRDFSPQPGAFRNSGAAMSALVSAWQTIGALVAMVWLPFQSERDRQLIDHLSTDERRDLLHRLGTVAICIAATTIAPVLIAFAFLSPLAVCVAATAIASNLFVLDWFKKRQKQWLHSTTYAREHASSGQVDDIGTTDGTDGHG